MTEFYPNARNNPAGAIPVFLSSSPKAMPIVLSSAPTVPNAGAIPVRIVAAPSGPGGTDQGVDANAIPVVESASPKAMPVWNVGSAPPLPPEVVESTFTRPFAGLNPPLALGNCTVVSGTVNWSLIDPGGLNLIIAAGSGQLLLMGLAGASVGTFYAVVQASNADGVGQGTITIIFT